MSDAHTSRTIDLDAIRGRWQVVEAVAGVGLLLAGQAKLRPRLLQGLGEAAARSAADVPSLLVEVELLSAQMAEERRQHKRSLECMEAALKARDEAVAGERASVVAALKEQASQQFNLLREQAALRFDLHGPHDVRGAAFWDAANSIAEGELL